MDHLHRRGTQVGHAAEESPDNFEQGTRVAPFKPKRDHRLRDRRARQRPTVIVFGTDAVEPGNGPPHWLAMRSSRTLASPEYAIRKSGVIAGQPTDATRSASDVPDRATSPATTIAANKPSSPPASALKK